MATGPPPSSSELRTCLCGTVVSGSRKSSASVAVASSSASIASPGGVTPGVEGGGTPRNVGPCPASSALANPSIVSSTTSLSSASSSIALAPSSSNQANVSSQKCRICRTKPKFLRGQRSLDLSSNSSPLASKRPEAAASVSNISSEAASPLGGPLEDVPGPLTTVTAGGPQTPTSSHSRPISQQPQRPAPTLRERRRARSAERYDGIRITRGERGASAIPRQTSVQPISGTNPSNSGGSGIRRPDQPPEYSSTEPLSLPLLTSYHNIPPPTHSPPPSYEAAMSKSLLPPSYDEYLAQKMQGLGGIGPGGSGASSMAIGGGPQYSWRSCDHPGSNIMPPPPPFPVTTPSRFQQQSISRAVASSYEPNQGQQSQHCCTCSKCKTRYGYYDDNSGNDVLFTLETQTAMQGILTDGVALCCMM